MANKFEQFLIGILARKNDIDPQEIVLKPNSYWHQQEGVVVDYSVAIVGRDVSHKRCLLFNSELLEQQILNS